MAAEDPNESQAREQIRPELRVLAVIKFFKEEK